jgi:hypothetical protein
VVSTIEPTILDGHNRYEICTRLGIEFEIIEVEDCHDREIAIAWIVANQLGRRNLTPSQKGPIGLALEKQLAAEAKKRQAHGQTAPGKTLPERFPEASDAGEARSKAAAMLGINPHYITDAEKIE